MCYICNIHYHVIFMIKDICMSNGEGIHVPSLQAVVAMSKNPCSGVYINSNISMLQNLTHVHV